MSNPGQMREPNSGSPALLFGVLGVGVGACVLTWLSLMLAGGQHVSGNPFAAVIAVVTGKLRWSSAATAWLVVLLVLLLAIAAAVLVLIHRHRKARPRTRIDTAHQHMGRGVDIASLSAVEVRRKAEALKVQLPEGSSPGVPIAEDLGTGRPLYGSFEDNHLDIWGPRMGKSTTRIIPAIAEAPGAVLATENKRGNLDATRLLREFRVDEHGRPDIHGTPTRKVWIFDPQSVADAPPQFYWDPLSAVHDEEDAGRLAQHFAMGEDGLEARKDPYFDPEGEDLVANLLLASALAGEPIGTVYKRLTVRDRCRDAVDILADKGEDMLADTLAARLNLAPKQQDGIFGTALKMVRCLRVAKAAPWISRTGPDDDRPHLDLHAFITGKETLYCLSREGVGSCGPIVAALTEAACSTAEKIAVRSPRGRLPVPMLCALDEAANCVRWKNLPNLYSHYGSRGILIMTILQSYQQGESTWGKSGMGLLMSAANVFVYGGNNKETSFLGDLSRLVGSYERQALNVSTNGTWGQSSTSRHTTKETILEVSDLQSMPRGRALVLSAGNRAALVRTVPWMARPYAHLIEASILEYDPAGEATLEAITEEAAEVDAELAALDEDKEMSNVQR